MITQKELEDYELSHHHNFGPFAMVEDIDAEYCRVAWMDQWFGSTAMLAYKPLLSVILKGVPGEPDAPRQPAKIGDGFLKKVKELRESIKSGRSVVRECRVVLR